MGEEADADWQTGLIEAGIEDTERWMREKQDRARQFARRYHRAMNEARRRKRIDGVVGSSKQP
jgi:hypothetical protein